MKHVNLHVGYDAERTKARILDAIRRAESGQAVSENHVTFESWESLAKVLTGKRLDLLRHLHAQPAETVAALARALKRDYKRVYEDVEILTAAGLIERSESGAVQAAYDVIKTSISLIRPAA